MRTVHFSDIRAEEGGLFRPDLMEKVVEEANDYEPDLVAFAGDLSGVRVVHSGTAASDRIRGTVGPSYNTIELGEEQIEVQMRDFVADDRKLMARFPLEPDRAAGFFFERERFVLYDELPF